MFVVIWYVEPASVEHQNVIEVCLVQAFPVLIADHVASYVALCALFVRCFSLGIMGVCVSHGDDPLQTPLQCSELLLGSEIIFLEALHSELCD